MGGDAAAEKTTEVVSKPPPQEDPVIRTLVLPADKYKFAKKHCQRCWGAGRYTIQLPPVHYFEAANGVSTDDSNGGAQKSMPGPKVEVECACWVKRFWKHFTDAAGDIGIGKDNAGALYFVRKVTPNEESSGEDNSVPQEG